MFYRTPKGQITKQDSSFPIAMNRLKARRKLRSQQLNTQKDPTSKVRSYLMTLDHSYPEFTNEVMVNINYNRMVGGKRGKIYFCLTLRALLSRCKACDNLVHLQTLFVSDHMNKQAISSKHCHSWYGNVECFLHI